MPQIDLDILAPDATLPKTGFIFGADDQASGPMSVYPLSALAQTLLGGTALSGDTVTTPKPLIDQAITWNAPGYQCVAWRVNITDTASFAGSLFFELLVNGSQKLKLAKDGSATFYNVHAAGSYTTAGNMWLSSDTGSISIGVAQDVRLWRTAGNVLALRNTGTAQAFEVYNTYTDASNYERLSLGWSGNVAYLRPQKAGTGSARPLIYQSGSVTVTTLPAAATAGEGARCFVTDATATTFLSVVAGGGANKVPVVSDGTNWLIG